MRLDVINGPNLNLLGRREPEIYGRETLADLEAGLRAAFPQVAWTLFQSNGEGALVDRLHWAAEHADGAILNAGALSHTSLSILDALRALELPVVEVHISQVLAREDFRHELLTARGAAALVCGMGLEGYHIAARHLLSLHQRRGGA
jgi:3-dehydroquinate dehydratase-2